MVSGHRGSSIEGRWTLRTARVRYVHSPLLSRALLNHVAEFRGPGNRRRPDEIDNDYEMDLDQRTQGMGGRSGRIILLGDGTEVLTESDDMDMFDHDEEDKDLDAQVTKGHVESTDEDRRLRSEREETPAPESVKGATQDAKPSPTMTEDFKAAGEAGNPPLQASPISIKSIPESAIPEKLVSPAKTE